MNNGKNFWTPDKIEELIRLHKNTDLTAREIGDRFGVSKSAIIGKLNRLGFNSSHRVSDNCVTEAERIANIREQKIAGQRERRAEAAEARAKLEADFARTIPLSERPAGGGCRFISIDPRDRPKGVSIEEMFCGRVTVDGMDWCQHHYDRVYQKKKEAA
jgi:hypothetical protein